MRTSGSTPAACACVTCARPISKPSLVTNEFNAMFCALNGATLYPSCFMMRRNALHSTLLPTDDAVPITIKLLPRIEILLIKCRHQ